MVFQTSHQIISLIWLFILAPRAFSAPGGPGPLLRIQLELTPEAAAGLRKEPREYVRAKIIAEGKAISDAGLHLKGTGSFQPLDEKPSFTLDFSKYVTNQRFLGFQKMHLNNSAQDPSFLREFIGARIFREAGFPVPRVAHAWVELNGRVLGLYVLKEGFTGDFLARSFPAELGTLYEPEKGQDLDGTMKRRAGQVSTRFTVHNPMDQDRLAAFLALEVMIGHWDGYGLGKNNFRVYQPLDSGFAFLPAGLDQIFFNAKLPWTPDMTGLAARALLRSPEGREKYQQAFRRLFQKHFDAKKFTDWVSAALAVCACTAAWRAESSWLSD